MIQDQVTKLKLNVTNIKSFLIKKNSEYKKLRIQRNSEIDRDEKLEKVKQKEKKLESPGIFRSSLNKISSFLLSKPMSLFDKIMNFLGYILLGLIVNELPRIIQSIKTFFDRNKWIFTTLKFFIKAVFTGIKGIINLVTGFASFIGKSSNIIANQRKQIAKDIEELSQTFNSQDNILSNILKNLTGGNKPPMPGLPPSAAQPGTGPVGNRVGQRPAPAPSPAPAPAAPAPSSVRPRKYASGGEVRGGNMRQSSPLKPTAGGQTGRQKAAKQSINYFEVFKNSVDKMFSTNKIEKDNNKKFKDLFELFKKMPSLFEGNRRNRPGQRPGQPPGQGQPQPPSLPPIPVNEKDVIGRLGSTGRSTGPHIHIETYPDRGNSIPREIKQNILVSGRNMIDQLYGPEDGNDGIGNHPWRISINNPTGYHAGEDFAGDANQPISLKGGLKFVKFIPDQGDGYGNRTIIQGPDGRQYSLNHLNSGPDNPAELKKRQEKAQQQQTPRLSLSQDINQYDITKRTQEGNASFYGGPKDRKWEGRQTRSGEIFNSSLMTAASNTFDMGTIVRVTNKNNGKQVIVKINDTGGFGELGRVIDLSYGAMKEIGGVESGVVPVKIEVLKRKPTPRPSPPRARANSNSEDSLLEGIKKLNNLLLRNRNNSALPSQSNNLTALNLLDNNTTSDANTVAFVMSQTTYVDHFIPQPVPVTKTEFIPIPVAVSSNSNPLWESFS